MMITRTFAAVALLMASAATAHAHVGNHAEQGLSHMLVEHGYLVAIAGLAVGALVLIARRNRSKL